MLLEYRLYSGELSFHHQITINVNMATNESQEETVHQLT